MQRSLARHLSTGVFCVARDVHTLAGPRYSPHSENSEHPQEMLAEKDPFYIMGPRVCQSLLGHSDEVTKRTGNTHMVCYGTLTHVLSRR
jgi:hypothetical protein